MADTYKPPQGTVGSCKKALRWREEHGDDVKGGTRVGWTRASQIASGESVSLDVVKRMHSFFSRHKGNETVSDEFKDEPWRDAGYVSFLLWGGATGRSWSRGISESEVNNNSENEIMAEATVIEIYGQIGQRVYAEDIQYQLEQLEGQDIKVLIDSPGGSLSEGVLIFNLLKAYNGRVTTVNVARAFSIASYIFLAGDERIMAENALMMIHEARCDTSGTSTQHAQNAKMLEAATASIRKEYAKIMGVDEAMIQTLWDGATDVWYTSDQALENNLATSVAESSEAMSNHLTEILAILPHTIKSQWEGKMKNDVKTQIKKLSALCNDSDLILNCVKNELSYEQSLEAIIKNMEEKDDESKAEGEEDEKKPEANEEEKVEATEEEDKVEATEEEEKLSAMEEFVKSNMDKEKYAEYKRLHQHAMEEMDKAKASEEDKKPEAEGDDEKVEASDDQNFEEMKNEDEDDMQNEDDKEEVKALLKTGVKPVAVSKSPSRKMTATQSWNGQIENRMAEAGCTRIQAISHVNKLNPELRQLMIDEANG